MLIHLNEIKPVSFQYRLSPNSIWGNKIEWHANKIYQIIAASGSGKTTLVSVLSGLRGDYRGDIIYNNKAFSDFTFRDWSKWRSETASFVFQDMRLFPELSAMDNIRIASELSTRHVINFEQIIKYTSDLGLEEQKLKSPVKYISLGQAQRIAIIRAISRNYEWLILDEPFSHLDINNAKRAWELIKQDAAGKNAGIIITSLDPYAFINPDQSFYL